MLITLRSFVPATNLLSMERRQTYQRGPRFSRQWPL